MDAGEEIKFLKHYRFGPIWDGNVPSKQSRDQLVDKGLIARACGFQFLTSKGVDVLYNLGLLNEDTWRFHPFSKRDEDGK